MCARLNNNTPVMIGRGAASCDMPAGRIQSSLRWLGCLLASWAWRRPSRVTAIRSGCACKDITITQHCLGAFLRIGKLLNSSGCFQSVCDSAPPLRPAPSPCRSLCFFSLFPRCFATDLLTGHDLENSRREKKRPSVSEC